MLDGDTPRHTRARSPRVWQALLIGGIAGCAGTPEAGEPSLTYVDGTRVSATIAEADVARIVEAARLPGLQVAVVHNGEIAYSNAFGVLESGGGRPVTSQTVFAALSFSKTMFAYLVLQLVGDGVLDLDRPMTSYLSRPLAEYDFYTDLAGEARTDALTARMALTHTTGFPNWRWFTPEGRLGFVYEPGERHSYSGEGIFLLQLVIEEVTGRGLEELARERIFEPLGMTRTSFLFLPEFEDDFAVDHDHYLNPIGKERRDEANSAGSAQTTAEDYARFLMAVMSGEGLSPEMREAVFTPQVDIQHARMFGPLARVANPAGSPHTSWGLGWGLVESEHGRAFFHTGNDRGAANYHVGFPGRGIAVVLLGSSQNLERAAPALTRLFVGDSYSPYEFLGYEPYDSPRGTLVEAIGSDGFAAGWAGLESIPAAEVKRWYPEEWALMDAVGQDLVGLGQLEAAIDLYEEFTDRYPDRQFGNDRLGAALAAAGHYEDAAATFRAGAESAEPGFWAELYGWKLTWAAALAAPASVPEAALAEYAGIYETRHVELREGELFYYREGTPDPTPQRMFAADEQTFVLEGNDSFRLRFDRDETGAVYRITGQYSDSDDDETLRTGPPAGDTGQR